jgi:peptide deformylase
MRAERVWARAVDLDGKTIKFQDVDDLLAQALEHEADHLDGVLYVDHLKTKDDLFEVTPGDEEVDEGTPRAEESESAPTES